MREIGNRVVRDWLPDQHRAFYAGLPWLVLGSVDTAGRPWATLLSGEPGFVTSPDRRSLAVARLPDDRDPAHPGVHPDAAVGLLGIELHSRRRNRVNGSVAGVDAGAFRVAVEHSFGNCPRYIQPRLLSEHRVAGRARAGAAEWLAALDSEALASIAHADTVFVASYADGVGDPPHRQVDVSHRGGEPGFVRLSDDGTLCIPDFPGNRHFNTLGNLMVNPRAGLLFPDFETGDLLQLTGKATVLLEKSDIRRFPGAERLWTVRPDHIVRRRRALELRFTTAR
jgi:hypothetical protein